MSPLPDRATPADLAVVPISDVTNGFVSVAARLALGLDAAGHPLTPAARADLALFALAHGASAVERITARLDGLARDALAAGASVDEVAAMLDGVRLETGPVSSAAVGVLEGFHAGQAAVPTLDAGASAPAGRCVRDRATDGAASWATGQETRDGAQETWRCR